MAIYINTLNGGSITIGSGGGTPEPTPHADTRFTLDGGTVETHNITGTIDDQWMIDNGYYIPYDDETGEGGYWEKTIVQADIGNTVTSIGDWVFFRSYLTNLTIPASVESIGEGAF